MQLLERLVYSESQKEYDKLYDELSKLAPAEVMDYYDAQWHNIQKEWTKFNVKSYGNYTNNRLEGGINSVLKRFVGHQLTLFKFIDEFFSYYINKNSNLELKEGMRTLRETCTDHQDLCLTRYQNLLSEFAFVKLLDEYSNRKPLTLKNKNEEEKSCNIRYMNDLLKVSTNSCTCIFFNNVKLPCRHIFACRQEFQMTLFASHLCDSHWLKVQDFSEKESLELIQASTPKPQNVSIKVKTPKPKNFNQKWRKVKMITNDIAKIVASAGGQLYENLLDRVLKFQDSLKQGEWEDPNICNSFAEMSLSEAPVEPVIVTPKPTKNIAGMTKRRIKTTVTYKTKKGAAHKPKAA